MAAQFDVSKLSVGQFAERFRGEMIPLSNMFSYFCASVPLTEEDVKEYLEEPIAALPPAIQSRLPRISIILVPYLTRGNNKTAKSTGEFISIEKPPSNRLSWATQVRTGNEEVLVFALKDQDVAEYHYRFYHLLATLMADRATPAEMERYAGLVRDELSAEIHGEVDEESWRRKQGLTRRGPGRKETKAFRDYVRQSFIDTLTLYLHGICCDIDVETGPRQLPSRYLRKRLQALAEMFPPSNGYAVFPEELNK